MRWLRSWFGSRAREHDLQRELRSDLESEAAEQEAKGLPPDEARYAARRAFGNPTMVSEQVRDVWGWTAVEQWLRDIKYGLRQMRKGPLFSVVLVLSLALGIGANSAIFSLVDAALLRALPVPDAQALRLIEWRNHGFPGELCNMMTGDSKGDESGMQGSSVSSRVYRELAQQQHGFASLIGFSDASMAAVAMNKQAAEQFRLQYVSANFFSGLGVPLQVGQPFSWREDRAGQPPVVILSDRFWRKRFAGRPDVVGQVLRVNNVPVEVAGVAGAGFFGLQIGEWVDLYAPLAAQAALSPESKLDRSFSDTDLYWWVRMMGRLRPEVTEAQARAELAALFKRLVVPAGVHVESEKVPKLIALPGQRGVDPMRADESRALWILFLLVGLILLIVCANVANLLLSRAVVRQRESAVCLALGAGRFRLFRQYLTESVMLAGAGGGAGLLLGYLLAQALHAFIRADMNIGGFDLHLSGQVLGFTCAVSLATAVVFGVAPAYMLTRASVNDALKANSRTVAGGRLRMPRLLVIAQIALSFAVLVAAGLLNRSLANLRRVDLGFNRANLVYVSVNPWSAGYAVEQVRGYVERMRGALASVPGVWRVATVELRPLSGDLVASTVNVPGRSYRQTDTASVNEVGEGFFETLGIPLLAGRTFEARDMNKSSNAVIVDEQFARQFYGGRMPVGEQFGTSGPALTEPYRIVGVVKQSRANSVREAKYPAMFRPSATASHPGGRVTFVLRTGLEAGQVARAFRRVSATIDPAIPVIAIETQTQLVNALLRSERLLSVFSGAFGLVALILSSTGLFGLLAYMVARRRNEIGVRIALGASRHHVAAMVTRDAFVLLTLGLAAGLPGAVVIGQMLKHTLFNLHPLDPITGLLGLATMAAIAGLSSWIPARRAARIDPMAALRQD